MDGLFKIGSIETFKQALEDILDNLYDLDHEGSDVVIDVSCIRSAKEEIKNVILNTNLNTNKTSELMSSKLYDGNRAAIFISLLENKKEKLLNSTIVHHNCEFGETLDCYNWRLKLVCGTSDLKTLSYPLLQLAFCSVTTSHKSKVRLYEFKQDMLLKLIGSLEELLEDKDIIEKT